VTRKQGFDRAEQDENTLAFREELRKAFEETGEEYWKSCFQGESSQSGSRIWAFGPHRIGPNILINQIPNYPASKYVQYA